MRMFHSLDAFENGTQPLVVHAKLCPTHRINMPYLKSVVRPRGIVKPKAQVKKITTSPPLPARLELSLKSMIGLKTVAYTSFARVVRFPSPSANEDPVVGTAIVTLVCVHHSREGKEAGNHHPGDHPALSTRPSV